MIFVCTACNSRVATPSAFDDPALTVDCGNCGAKLTAREHGRVVPVPVWTRVRLWFKGEDVLRVTGRKDQWGELEDTPDGKPGWICNDCRFGHKKVSDWTIEGPSHIDRHSVISANHYELAKLKLDTGKQLKELKSKKAAADKK